MQVKKTKGILPAHCWIGQCSARQHRLVRQNQMEIGVSVIILALYLQQTSVAIVEIE